MLILGAFSSEQDRQETIRLADSLDLGDSVAVLGHVSNVGAYYARARVHIMPSSFEGAPMVFFEAKAHGVPSVLYDLPYLDASTENEGCVMVGKADVAGMADAVIRLMQDDVYWHDMSEKALRSLDSFSNERVLQAWQNLFQDICTDNVPQEYAFDQKNWQRL